MNVDWSLVFQGVKTILDPIAAASWPIAIGIVAWAFRGPITTMIGRVRQVSGFGGSAEFVPQEAKQQAVGVSESSSLPAPAGTTSPPTDPVYDLLDGQLITFLDQSVQGDMPIKLAWAIRARSISEANRLHELHYRLIFGSQIIALKGLNVVGQGPVSEFENLYNRIATDPANEAIHKDRTFEQWGQFLINAGYVEAIEGSEPPAVRITPFGRQFLQWMVIAAAPEIKPG